MKRMSLVATIVVLSLTISGCVRSASDEGSFELAEFSVSGSSHLEAGRSNLTANNSGEFAHTLVVTTDEGVVVAATDLIQPGESAQLSVDLTPGNYQITCRIVTQIEDGSLIDHYEAGMNQMVEVIG